MTAPTEHGGLSLSDRFFGKDRPVDLLLVVALFAVYAALDIATRVLSEVRFSRLDDPVLVIGAVRSNLIPSVVALVAFIVVLWRWPRRLFAPWDGLMHGKVLRSFAVALVLVLVWQGSFYEYNFLLDQAHGFDRILLAALGVGVVFRPAFLSFFALQARIIAGQFEYPFGTTAAQNIDELLILGLLAIAGAHLLWVFTSRNHTAPVLLVLGAVIATHFFVPGRSKLGIEWLSTNQVSNFPLSGYTAGWLGQGDGTWSRQMSRIASNLNAPLLVGTLMVELGSVIAVLHYKLMRWWIPFALVFHLVTFAFVGFWFLTWITFEVGLWIIFTRPELREWLQENATPARGVLTALLVVFAGTFLFHPPKLAWLDSPVSYGYRIEATGRSGDLYQVPFSALSPLVQELSFFNLRLDSEAPVSGGYGAVGSPERYRTLLEIGDFDQLEAIETPADSQMRIISQQVVALFMNHANSGRRVWWSPLAPPDHFWTGVGSPTYRFEETIDELRVFVLTAIHRGDEPVFRRELVLTLGLDDDGRAQVIFPEP